MRILGKEYKETSFSDIKIGKCFYYKNYLHIKTNGVFGHDGNLYNAVVIFSGENACFSQNDKVYMVESDLTLENF